VLREFIQQKGGIEYFKVYKIKTRGYHAGR